MSKIKVYYQVDEDIRINWMGIFASMLSIFYLWIQFIIMGFKTGGIPIINAEFIKCLIAVHVMAVFVTLLWIPKDNEKRQNRQYRCNFRKNATKTTGTIIEVKSEHLNQKMKFATNKAGKGVAKYWKVKVAYLNEYSNSYETVWSGWYREDPVKKTGKEELDVYYKKNYAQTGDFTY